MISTSSAGEQSATVPIRRTPAVQTTWSSPPSRAAAASTPAWTAAGSRTSRPVERPSTSTRAPAAAASVAMASPMPLVPPTTRTRAPSSDRCGRSSGRGIERLHLDHPVGEDHVQPRRDLHVRLVTGHRDEAGARDVAQDEAAVVGCAEVAGRGRGFVGPGEDLGAEDLRRLAAAVARPVRDLDDVLAVDDHEGVRARDDRVRRVGRPRGDRRDRPLDDLERDERADGVVDDDGVGRIGRRGCAGRSRCSRSAWCRRPPRSWGPSARPPRRARPSRSSSRDGRRPRSGPRRPPRPCAGSASGRAHRRDEGTAWATRRRTGCHRRRPGGWRGCAPR